MQKKFVAILLTGVGLGALSYQCTSKSRYHSMTQTSETDEKPATAKTEPSETASEPLAPRPAEKVRTPSSLTEAVTQVLSSYSQGNQWQLSLDEGYPHKMSGKGLKQVVSDDAQARRVLKDLTQALGFQSDPVLLREPRDFYPPTTDYMQLHTTSSGDTIPVYGAWIRFIGDSAGDASLIINSLQPVAPSIRTDIPLAQDRALQIADTWARAEYQDPLTIKFKLQDPAVVIYTQSSPHQLVTLVEVTGVVPHRLLLIGHETQSVVAVKNISRF